MASWVPGAQARAKPPRARSCPPVRRNARACLPAAAHAPGQSGAGAQPSRPLVSAPAKGGLRSAPISSTPASAAPTPPARSRALLRRLYLWWWRSCLVRAAGRALVHGLKPSRQGRSRDGERAQKAVLGEPGGRFTSDQGAAVARRGAACACARARARQVAPRSAAPPTLTQRMARTPLHTGPPELPKPHLWRVAVRAVPQGDDAPDRPAR